MRSIDNLRDYVLTAPSICSTTRAILVGYVDEIEREVEELRDRDYRNGREDAKGAVEFADRLKAAVDKREDVTLFGVEYTALPVDADGMPLALGDEVQPMGYEPGTVTSVEVRRDGRAFVGVLPHGWDVPTVYDAEEVRHHHAPTVEDVLREFTDEVWNRCCEGATASDSGIDELVAEYAAKLRLAGEE